jgi:hypothetical protein
MKWLVMYHDGKGEKHLQTTVLADDIVAAARVAILALGNMAFIYQIGLAED